MTSYDDKVSDYNRKCTEIELMRKGYAIAHSPSMDYHTWCATYPSLYGVMEQTLPYPPIPREPKTIVVGKAKFRYNEDEDVFQVTWIDSQVKPDVWSTIYSFNYLFPSPDYTLVDMIKILATLLPENKDK